MIASSSFLKEDLNEIAKTMNFFSQEMECFFELLPFGVVDLDKAVGLALRCELFEESLEDPNIGLCEKWQHPGSGEFAHLGQIRLFFAAQHCQEQARQCVRVMCFGVPHDEGWNQ